jgi:hypothetical protein
MFPYFSAKSLTFLLVMEALEQRLYAIEEAVGTLPPGRQSLHSDIASLRDELKSLKMDLVLKAPAEKLRELHKDPPIVI